MPVSSEELCRVSCSVKGQYSGVFIAVLVLLVHLKMRDYRHKLMNVTKCISENEMSIQYSL